MDTTVNRSEEYYADYDKLREYIETTHKELLTPDPSFLFGQIVDVCGFLATGLGLLWFARGSLLLVVLGAAFLAFAFGRAGFMQHDACHVVGNIRWKRPARMFFNVLFAWSMDGWDWKHTLHHEFPNDPRRDPDTAVGIMAFTPEQAQQKTSFARFVTRHQHVLLLPLLLFEAWNLRMGISSYLLKQGTWRARTDVFLMAVHVLVYLGALVYFLSPWRALAVVVLHNGLLGLYLGLVFAVNHIGMKIATPDDKLDYLRSQVVATRNVVGGRWLTSFLGGLNYQIEHHLFPWLTWRQLAAVAPFVQAFCLERGVAYRAERPWKAFGQVLAHCRAMARCVA